MWYIHLFHSHSACNRRKEKDFNASVQNQISNAFRTHSEVFSFVSLLHRMPVYSEREVIVCVRVCVSDWKLENSSAY